MFPTIAAFPPPLQTKILSRADGKVPFATMQTVSAKATSTITGRREGSAEGISYTASSTSASAGSSDQFAGRKVTSSEMNVSAAHRDIPLQTFPPPLQSSQTPLQTNPTLCRRGTPPCKVKRDGKVPERDG